jgi:hypothetical protein
LFFTLHHLNTQALIVLFELISSSAQKAARFLPEVPSTSFPQGVRYRRPPAPLKLRLRRQRRCADVDR